MAFQAAPNIAGVQMIGSVDGQVTINDLYFELSGGAITPINLAVLVNAVSNWFTITLAPLLSDDWSTNRVVGVDLGSPTGARREQAGVVAGGVSGEALPNNVAACVSFRTDSRGRSGHGRNFVPGLPDSLVTLNTLDPTFISDLLTAYFALVGAGTFEAGWQLVVLSRVTAGMLRPNGIGFPVVDMTMTSTSVRSMRSREIGHGA